MGCLYENNINKHKCNCLNKKECYKCKFYKDDTKENYEKYILQTEKDIENYGRYSNG